MCRDDVIMQKVKGTYSVLAFALLQQTSVGKMHFGTNQTKIKGRSLPVLLTYTISHFGSVPQLQ